MTVLHLGWAAALCVVPGVQRITALAGLFAVFGGRAAVVLVLVLGVVGSEVAIRRHDVRWAYGQQALLVLAAAQVVGSAWVGHYPDGYVPEGGGWSAAVFILTDQGKVLLTLTLHTMALLTSYRKGCPWNQV